MTYSLEKFHREYETDTRTVKIGEHQLSFLKPKSIDRFIDADNDMQHFPLWAKLWESSAILCTYLAGLPVTSGQRLLEIGAGMGVAGIVAASLGHNITITEYDDHALHFIRANAKINGCSQTPVFQLDWRHPDMHRQFDLIIGSEVTYRPENIPVLVSLFNILLAPGGKVVLAENVRATGTALMDAMEPYFDITVARHRLRSANKSQTVLLFSMQSRKR